MAYNQSRIKLWRRCQKAYDFRYHTQPGKELVSKYPSLPLKRGSWLHALQEAWHREWAGVKGADWQETHGLLTTQFDLLFDEEKELYGDLPNDCRRLFNSYLRCWREEDAKRYRVATLKNGGGPAVEFVIEVPLDRYRIGDSFKARIDLLVEDIEYGGLWIWDAKWVRSLPSFSEGMMSPQKLLYVWALRKHGYPIHGFVYNFGRTKPPTIPRLLKRPYGMLSIASKMDTTYWTYLSALKEAHGTEWKRYARMEYYQPTLLRLKERGWTDWFVRQRQPADNDQIKRALGEFIVSCRDIEARRMPAPRTYDYRCKYSCSYHEPCVAQFTGLDISGLLKTNYTLEEERYEDGREEFDEIAPIT